MTNAEKYPNTQGALEAWRMYGDRGGDKPFDLWLSLSADVVPAPTLQEAAERLIMDYVNNLSKDVPNESWENLRKAVKREKKKPVKNFDRFATAKEAEAAFGAMCASRKDPYLCSRGCPVEAIRKKYGDNKSKCDILWLYAEAERKRRDERT